MENEISEKRLAELCAEKGAKMRIKVLAETESTNDDALKILRHAENCAPFAVFTNRQRAGRGRNGRKWAGENFGNIYASFGFAPKIVPAKMANFTLWMGVSVCAMLAEKYGVPAQIKWPNDLFCAGKKLSGILTEVHTSADCVHGIVLGIGLNVLARPEEFSDIATSLAEEMARRASAQQSASSPKKSDTLDVSTVAADLVACVESAAQKFFAGTFQEIFPALWARYDLLAGKSVAATYDDETISGTAQGIDEQGRLQILTPHGEVRFFAAGDATLKKRA